MLDITPLHLRVDRTLLDPWRKLLLDAADYIDKHGWIQGHLTNGLGAVCARGALFMACDGILPSITLKVAKKISEADRKLSSFICGISGVYDIPTWNDQHAKSQAEVTGAMRACALENVDQF